MQALATYKASNASMAKFVTGKEATSISVAAAIALLLSGKWRTAGQVRWVQPPGL